MDRALFAYRHGYTAPTFYIWVFLQLWVKNVIFAIYDDELRESSAYFLSDY